MGWDVEHFVKNSHYVQFPLYVRDYEVKFKNITMVGLHWVENLNMYP